MKSEITQKYNNLISTALHLPHPRILINICSHGNEILGLDVSEELKKVPIAKGSLTFHIGNPEALRQKKRFIESDLNRSFPGLESGKHEERIAFEMMRYIPYFDYVIDIHATVSGMIDCLIVEDDSQEIQSMTSVCNHAQTVLHMNATKGSSIFTATRLSDRIIPSLAFEYGNNDILTTKKTTEDISAIMRYLGVFAGENPVRNNTLKQFDCYEVCSKLETDITNPLIVNYELIRSGDVIGITVDGQEIYADCDFYPVLFGETNYRTIFGFKARKL